MPTDGEGTRIGDAERQQVIDALSRATGEGRLTLDEFADRAGDVFAARTRDELDRVIADLPADVTAPRWPPRPARPEAPAPSASPAEAEDARAAPAGRRRFVAIMGGSRPRGRWRAAGKITAFAFWGGVTIDLRQALIESPTLDISAWAIMGGVNVIVPKGIRVELDGFVLMGGAIDRTRPGRPIDGAPVVRVRARGLWGGVSAWTRRQRGASDERAGETGDSLDDLGDRLGVPIPPMPPMPQLPGPSLDGAIPPMSRRDRQRERHRDRERARDWAREWAQAAHRGHWGANNSNSAGNSNRAGNSNNAGNVDNAGGSGPTGSMRGTGPATPTATTAGDPAPAGASPEPATGATETNHRPPGGGTLTVVVTDICRSTEMASRLGDQRWLGVLQTHNALVRDQIRRHHGTEVKAQGDGFLVTFTSARQAVLGAIGIQRAMAGYRRAHPEHQVELRVGVHTGEVVEDHGDVIGQNVIVAVRIADAATPGEILVSSLTKDLTDAGGDLGYDDGREVELKGMSRAWRVHAVEWV